MSQIERLYNLLQDGAPHSTVEILDVVYGGGHLGLARVGARIYDIKKRYHVNIRSWNDPHKPSVHWYQIGESTKEEMKKKYPELYGGQKHAAPQQTMLFA